MIERIAIIGTSHAGVTVAEQLRRKGFEGEIDLFGREPVLPYQRPPLSKQYLQGKLDEERLWLRQPDFYDDRKLTLHLDAGVEQIEPALHRLTLDNGGRFYWDALILATGSHARVLDVAGADLEGVHYLMTLNDANLLLKDLERDIHDVVVIGGGFIGLECASELRMTHPDARISVVHARSRLLSRSVSEPLSSYVEKMHQEQGVELKLDANVSALRPDSKGERVGAVVLDDGRTLPADLVVVGIGAEPETALAQAAGLECSALGIKVDSHLATSEPDIYAIGDCTCVDHPLAGGVVNIKSIQNAVDQARVLAANLCGEEQDYNSLPWFWSDQYRTHLQMAGHFDGDKVDQVVTRGDVDSGKFSLFCYQQGRLSCVESVNQPVDHMMARRLLQKGVNVTPEEAIDVSVPLQKKLS